MTLPRGAFGEFGSFMNGHVDGFYIKLNNCSAQARLAGSFGAGLAIHERKAAGNRKTGAEVDVGGCLTSPLKSTIKCTALEVI